jgi:hypothetical protein
MPTVARRPKQAARDNCSGRQAQNAHAAAIILADVEQYGGDEAGLVRWAKLVASRIGLQATAPPVEQATLQRAAEPTLFDGVTA